MTISANSFISVSDLEAFFGVSDYRSDTNKINIASNAAFTAIERFCSRSFLKREYTARFFSAGGSAIMLDHYPVRSILSFDVLNRNEIVKTLSTSDYYIDSTANDSGIVNIVSLLLWPRAQVSIVYEAGFTLDEVPADLKYACLIQTQFFYRSFNDSTMLGYSSISKMQEQITKDSEMKRSGLLSEVSGIADNYRRFESPNVDSFMVTI